MSDLVQTVWYDLIYNQIWVRTLDPWWGELWENDQSEGFFLELEIEQRQNLVRMGKL